MLDDLKEKDYKNDKIQSMIKRGRHINLSIFIISQYYYELPKRTIRAMGNIYYIFKPNNVKDVQNLYQDKASMDMTLNKFKLITSTRWNKKHQPLTFDMTKHKSTSRYQLGLNSLFVPDSSPF